MRNLFKESRDKFLLLKSQSKPFVGSACAASYNNKHTTREPRVSKFEKWIQTRISEVFPKLEVFYSSKTALEDAGEVDVWIPSLKLAFEIQGVSHFEPIYGEERLLAEQANDENKRKIAKELSVELIEIDISKVKEFKKSIPFMMAVDKVLSTIRHRLKSLPNANNS